MPVTKIKIAGIPKESEYNAMPLGRQIEYRHKLQAFKNSAKRTHLSQKRQSHVKALREFVKLNDVTEYYACFNADKHNCYDDTFEVFYK